MAATLALLALLAAGGADFAGGMARRHCGEESTTHFSNEWVVRLEGGPIAAEALAEELGYTFKGPVRGFADTYRIEKSDHPRVQKRAHRQLTQRLARDARVVWAEQQFAKSRQKRFAPPLPDGARVRRADLPVPDRRAVFFNDELWAEQWYLQDTRTRPDLPKLDLHVLPVYAAGVTGRGVRVSVLDDGVEHNHEDLRDNYDPQISYDANDDDTDPAPRYDAARTNAHGTRCAGEIAMRANNRKCGVGVAYNARVGGVRLLDGEVNDRVEGTALGFAHRLVDVYSASWGPNDDGMTVEGPGRLALEAIERGIREGRGGRGAIYVWASGNGGARGDNCDCDGYIGSIYTLAVGSASQRGHFPWYGERCAATMAATYSSGAYSDQMIATTDLGNSCTIRHTGTSASAPLAAGIVALALEVNPELTWRDVQHLVVWTSEYAPLSDNEGWRRNAAGFWVSTRFGFGLMNAAALVALAANWTAAPPAALCLVPPRSGTNSSLTSEMPVVVHFLSDACAGTVDEVNFLEHVQVEVTIEYPVRGELQVFLTSPAGTQVQLLGPRPMDESAEGFVGWRFLSVLTWGEGARGRWALEVRADRKGRAQLMGPGRVGACTLRLHGTRLPPALLAQGPRQYDDNYNRVHRKAQMEEEAEEETEEAAAVGARAPAPVEEDVVEARSAWTAPVEWPAPAGVAGPAGAATNGAENANQRHPAAPALMQLQKLDELSPNIDWAKTQSAQLAVPKIDRSAARRWIEDVLGFSL